MIPQILAMASNGLSSLGPAQSAIQMGANAIAPVNIPSPGELLWLLNQGHMPGIAFKMAMRLHGQDWLPTEDQEKMIDFGEGWFRVPPDSVWHRGGTMWNNLIYANQFSPTMDELNRLWNRDLVAPSFYRWHTKMTCGNHPEWVKWHQELAKEYPGSSDLIRFAVREAFDAPTVQQYDYHKEVPTALLPYMKAQGLGWEIPVPIPAGSTDNNGNPRNGNMNWLDAYWYAHWELPSLTQGYEMLHRLYPDSEYDASPDHTPGNEFVAADMEKLLKAQDIPEYWRKKLIAISYHSINVTDAKKAFELGVGDDAQYYHSLRRMGYNNDDALHMLEIARKQQERNLGIEPAKVTADWICSHYKTGVLTDPDAKQLLENNGFTNAQATALVAKCNLEFKSTIAKNQLTAYKRLFFSGINNKVSTKLALIARGLNPVIINPLVDSWELMRDSKYKLQSTRQILEAYSNSIVNVPDTIAHLQNLDYPATQISIMMNNANYKVNKKNAAIASRLAKEAARVAKENIANANKIAKATKAAAAATAKAAQAKIDHRVRGIAKASTDKNVIEWFKNGLVTLIDVYYRLFIKGFTRLDADLWVVKNLGLTPGGAMTLAKTKAATVYHSEGNRPIPADPIR